jgi:hypothetical protein
MRFLKFHKQPEPSIGGSIGNGEADSFAASRLQ